MNQTGIEYLTHTWNPIAMRCTPVSEGCAHCWHLRMADRMRENPNFPDGVREAYAGNGPPVLLYHRLQEPVHRKKHAIIGVQFMGDLFHKNISDYFINDVFDMMVNKAPWHMYIVLTKRAQAMYEWITENDMDIPPHIIGMVTAENQECADERIPWLIKTPFAVRGVSAEPMLGPVSLGFFGTIPHSRPYALTYERLNWAICGFETGPGARPGDFAWARDLRNQCKAAGVPFFFKKPNPGQTTPDDLMIREWPGEA